MARKDTNNGVLCSATSKRSGKQCQRWAMQGKNVCHLHGGKSKSGPASGTYKHGRYSESLPKRLLDRYHESLNDREALEQMDEVHVLTALIKDQMLAMKKRAHVPYVLALDLTRAWSDFKKARRLDDGVEMAKALERIDVAIRQIGEESRAREELTKRLTQKTRLVESERRRLVENKQMMHLEEVMTLFSAVTELITSRVKDPVVLDDIQLGLTRLINARSGVRPTRNPSLN